MNPLMTRSARKVCVLLVGLLLTVTSCLGNALEVSGEPVSDTDIQLLPPVCKLIMVDVPGIHMGGGGNSTKFGHLLNKPEYVIARQTPHFHHYCWALVNKMRYFRADSAKRRNFLFSRIMDDTDYVLRNSPKDWPFFYVVLLNQGLMMMLQGDYKGSIAKAEEALRQKPDEERAYALEFDVYMRMQDNNSAISAARKGLEKNPGSEMLRRRLTKLGVHLPPKPLAAEPASSSPPDTAGDSPGTVHSHESGTAGSGSPAYGE